MDTDRNALATAQVSFSDVTLIKTGRLSVLVQSGKVLHFAGEAEGVRSFAARSLCDVIGCYLRWEAAMYVRRRTRAAEREEDTYIVHTRGRSRWRNKMHATPATEKEQKDSRLSIRASEQEKAILAQAARARHMNTSQFVLQASLDAAHAVLMDQTEFRLPRAQWEAFRQRLDEPARVIPELRQVFSEPEPFGEIGA